MMRPSRGIPAARRLEAELLQSMEASPAIASMSHGGAFDSIPAFPIWNNASDICYE